MFNRSDLRHLIATMLAFVSIRCICVMFVTVVNDVCCQCSFSVCYATRDENARHVQEFVDRYEADSDRTFNCYYDTETKDNVIDHKAYTSSDVIHCLLWPSLILFVCAFVFIYIELKRRNIDGTPHETGFNGGRPPLQHRDSRGVSDGDVVLVAVNRPPTVQHPTRVSSHDERSRPTG